MAPLRNYVLKDYLQKSYDYLLEINIWEYCKYINPHMNSGWEEQLNYVERLKKDLAKAIENQEFEQAAVIRDKIKELENI